MKQVMRNSLKKMKKLMRKNLIVIMNQANMIDLFGVSYPMFFMMSYSIFSMDFISGLFFQNDKFILSVGMTVTHICLVPCFLRDRTRIRKKRNKKKYPRLASSYFSTVELHFLVYKQWTNQISQIIKKNLSATMISFDMHIIAP